MSLPSDYPLALMEATAHFATAVLVRALVGFRLLGRSALCWLAPFAILGGPVWASEAAVSRVGKVALAVGEVTRIAGDGTRSVVKSGDSLHEQDRLVTGGDALVMVVFVDQARLSLRPDTEVLIRRYRIDPSGADTRLDMELIRGTVRQISGEAARRQPERYRLNTPIATIGVRGTDFLARASASKVETYVHEGMIVVLPPSELCRVNCPILASSSAGDVGRYLQILSGGVVQRAVVPPEDLERLFGIRAATSRERDVAGRSLGVPIAGSGMAGSSLPPIMPLIFADPHAGGTRLSVQHSGATVGAGSGSGSVGQPSMVDAPAPGPLFVAPEVALAPLPSNLVWGRFNEPLQIPVTLAIPYDDAREGRHVTVGELSQYALWRSDPRGTLMPALVGQATFALSAAQSFYRTAAGDEVATVLSARLSADFDLARFSTELGLRSASGVSTVLSATGRINDEGIFLSLAPDGTQRVAGAFSRNGAEAGYLFNKVVGSGVFQGITLWGRRP
jgi:hypothetical protein